MKSFPPGLSFKSGNIGRKTGHILLMVCALALLIGLTVNMISPTAWNGMGKTPTARSGLQEMRLPPLPLAGRPGAVAPSAELLPIAPESARELNAARPFSTAKLAEALPFRSRLAGEQRDRAITCLAVAALYEAGTQANDQFPVMQVILNRVRHPAWPDSVCGVVFQGSERRTGCQFSFTCDGSLDRYRPSSKALALARIRAEAMLDGLIDKRVGLATHYHTDWVLPYWSNSLEKIAGINTHLFFSWRGFWGTRAAFGDASAAEEPKLAKLASFSNSHLPDNQVVTTETIKAQGPTTSDDGPEMLNAGAGSLPSSPPIPQVPVFRLALGTRAQPGRWALDAVALCGNRPDCRVVGWFDSLSEPAHITSETLVTRRPDFVYVQEMRNRVRLAYWDCTKWSKAPTSQCLSTGAMAAELVY